MHLDTASSWTYLKTWQTMPLSSKLYSSMDTELTPHSSSNLLARPQPAEVDLGYLAAFDTTPTDPELYSYVLHHCADITG